MSCSLDGPRYIPTFYRGLGRLAPNPFVLQKPHEEGYVLEHLETPQSPFEEGLALFWKLQSTLIDNRLLNDYHLAKKILTLLNHHPSYRFELVQAVEPSHASGSEEQHEFLGFDVTSEYCQSLIVTEFARFLVDQQALRDEPALDDYDPGLERYVSRLNKNGLFFDLATAEELRNELEQASWRSKYSWKVFGVRLGALGIRTN